MTSRRELLADLDLWLNANDAYRATPPAFRAALWQSAFSHVEAISLEGDELEAALYFIVSEYVDGLDLDLLPDQIEKIRSIGERYGKHPDIRIGGLARRLLLGVTPEAGYWPFIVSAVRSGRRAIWDAQTLFELGQAGDQDSRSVVEDVIASPTVHPEVRNVLERRLRRPGRYANWRRQFYAELCDRLAMKICPIDPHARRRAAKSQEQFSLVTGIGAARAVELTSMDWDAAVRVTILTSSGEVVVGTFSLSDADSPPTAARSVEAILAKLEGSA
jgi:hypothetical protein